MTTPSKPESGIQSTAAAKAPLRQELRCAVRFPVALPVLLTTDGGEFAAVTRNMSASGVLLELDHSLMHGAEIRFSLRMPHSVLGTPQDVLVHCAGRVIRCCLSQKLYLAAATIDDYRFAEH